MNNKKKKRVNRREREGREAHAIGDNKRDEPIQPITKIDKQTITDNKQKNHTSKVATQERHNFEETSLPRKKSSTKMKKKVRNA